MIILINIICFAILGISLGIIILTELIENRKFKKKLKKPIPIGVGGVVSSYPAPTPIVVINNNNEAGRKEIMNALVKDIVDSLKKSEIEAKFNVSKIYDLDSRATSFIGTVVTDTHSIKIEENIEMPEKQSQVKLMNQAGAMAIVSKLQPGCNLSNKSPILRDLKIK